MTTAAVIFDLDGLLLDSENFWQLAEYEQFAALGVPLSPADTLQTLGWRTDNVVQFWYEKHPWVGMSRTEVGDLIIERVIGMIASRGRLMPGAREALQLCQDLQLPIALATSSNHRMMLFTLEHFELMPFFSATCSAEFLPLAKPHPQVYLNAAAALNVDPRLCIAFEDSVTGVIAAKAARMRCFAVPDQAHATDPRYGVADRVLPSLQDLTPEMLTALV